MRKSMLLGTLCLLLIGCTVQTADCDIKSTVLDVNTFPKGTKAEDLESPSPDAPKESASRTFYYAPDLIFHEIIRWEFPLYAKGTFVERSESVFDVDEYMGPWETPSEIDFKSSIADNYRVSCGLAHGIYQCRMIATYHEYFVFFRSYISDQGIDLLTYNNALKEIDRLMGKCIRQ